MSDKTGSSPLPFVAIIMPTLNEERYIEEAISSILPAPGSLDYELLVMDGGSTDRTREIVTRLQKSNERLRLIDNPGRIQSAAMNLAAKLSNPRTKILVRADCHSIYPEGFVVNSVKRLIDKKTASVVVPLISEGQTCLQRAIAAAQRSPLGNGGSHHRLLGMQGYIDHGHHAAFDKKAYLELGGYDEEFTHNEDAEFDFRLTASGQKIYLDGDLVVRYFPRSSLVALAKQYRHYGKGRAKNILKHGIRPKLRQILPVLLLLGSVTSLGLAVVMPWFALFPIAYLMLTFFWGAMISIVNKDPCQLLSGPAAVIMHMSWASGFLLYQIRNIFS